MISPMHYGFAQPFLTMLLAPFAAFVLVPSVWIALGVATVFVLLLCGAGALAQRRALSQIRRWAAARGIRDVQQCRRGGFVSWDWSLWTFAELGPYRGVAADGSPRELLASYHAPAFGLVVFTYCEVR